ncbi:flagellar hook assembly protein FlgD [Halomonas sp. YLGW01]|uniref:flagellar hook assembly protein FlgD n=1 Tax=Halomonas sp. YLGW01 TaxID=2773308 RepID=UPI001785B360|nr:flagellar hook assembly protein FlgD [Halomonas sp. YLGW01]
MTNAIDAGLLSRLNGTPDQAKGSERLGGSAAKLPSQAEDLGDSFMTLLVTQLKNQDPLNPMENAEMTSQLAQINTVSGIEDLDKTLNAINDQIGAGQTLQAAGLVGKGVLVPGDRLLVSGGEAGNVTTPFGIDLAGPADSVEVTITDGTGQVVEQFDAGAQDAGVTRLSWDGTGTGGTPVAPGGYTVRLEAIRGEESVTARALNYAEVGGVVPQQDGAAMLDLGAVYGQAGLNDVKQIL